MINVNEQLVSLVTALTQTLKSSKDTLNDVINGMTLARNLVCKDDEKARISLVIDKLSNVHEILASFHINIRDENDRLELTWTKTGSSEQYCYNEDSDLTEKTFHFILMTFDREINQRLSLVEASNNGYIRFCYCIRNSIHQIITQYMTN